MSGLSLQELLAQEEQENLEDDMAEYSGYMAAREILKKIIAGICNAEELSEYDELLKKHSSSIFNYEMEETKIDFLEELKRMKEHRFNQSMSLYDILVTNDPNYTRDPEVMEIAKPIEHQDCSPNPLDYKIVTTIYHRQYQYYSNLLQEKVELDRIKLELIKPAKEAFEFLINNGMNTKKAALPKLPHELTEKILCHLDGKLLKEFIESVSSLKI